MDEPVTQDDLNSIRTYDNLKFSGWVRMYVRR
jgi:hypothetical protein